MSRRMCRNCCGCCACRRTASRNCRPCCASWSSPARSRASRAIATSCPREADLIPGRIRMNRAGKGFLQPDDSALKEIAIAESATGTALHEDRVLVRRDVRKNFRSGDDAQETGTVVRILERKRTQIVGTLQQQQTISLRHSRRPAHSARYLCAAAARRGPARAHRRQGGGRAARMGIAPHQSRRRNRRSPRRAGRGRRGHAFRAAPIRFAAAFSQSGSGRGARHRLDGSSARFRRPRWIAARIKSSRLIPTTRRILTTRSVSNAFRRSNGGLWVHIADVSHYVKPGTALDAEAQKRGNSTYLVDRVIPMLPEALSNELCSLKPNVDRLTKCVEFLVSNDGRVLNTKFHSAVIHSQRRFAYGQVLEILQRAPTDDPIEQMLHQAHELAQKIRRHRFKNGSLDLDFPETKIRLDEHGKILRIEKNENDVSHQLIEEYMLLANEAVATRLMSLRTPAIYRIHEEPDARRLQEYRQEVLAHHVAVRQLEPARRSAKAVAKARHAADWPGAENRFSQIAHAGALRGRAARPLRTGQEKIHALHVAHPPLRRPRGASRVV